MLVCTLTVKKNLFLEFNLLKDEKCFQIKIQNSKMARGGGGAQGKTIFHPARPDNPDQGG